MAYYPVFLELKNRPCLVIGGGRIAWDKARQLVRAGARVTVVAPVLGAGMKRLKAGGRVRWRRKTFGPGDLKGVELVIAGTDQQPVNERVFRECRRRRIWVNVVDQPKLCAFIVPSMVRRGRLTLAISTGGASPALSKWIRKDLERRYGPELGRLLTRLARGRGKILKAVPDYNKRKRVYEAAMQAYFEVLKKRIGWK
ncbi:MAG: siroheme synthase [Candidatus Omnitrophica bacterium CG11_big_fil_rev_8_21_14_0_20_64_10]|nr:MAG: siroheme synthase [Candidatus Omnitrophica bacterium CG11_big_fil_rev_8_21_14_0_20_64_10]